MNRFDRVAGLLRDAPPVLWDGAPTDRASAIAMLSRSPVSQIVGLRAGSGDVGRELTDAMRDELLGKLAAGQYVELELEVLAYEQKPGVRNSQGVRVRDGAMMSFGKAGSGRPFLRDHQQGNSLARGGTILDSATEKRGAGDYVVRQKIKLTATWAVDMALRGLLDSLSVGIDPAGGEVLCSVCGTPVFEDCFHFRNEEVMLDGEPVLVEWIFEQPEISETSIVNIPAVATAHVEAIRAVLSGVNSGTRAIPAQKENTMKTFLAALVATLGLGATATEEEVTTAVGSLRRERDTFEARLGIVEGERARLAADVDRYRVSERDHAAGEFISAALSSGRIAPTDESVWRKLYAIDPAAAQVDMAKRPAGCATPVGLARQTPPEDAAPRTATVAAGGPVDLKATLTANGADAAVTLGLAKAFGVKNPEKSIPQALGLNTEV